MAEIRLPRLPDRTPLKITLSLSPELAQALGDYAAAYEAAYGESEPLIELIPAILSAYLEGDRGFVRARKSREAGS